jgi:mycofactocin precursor
MLLLTCSSIAEVVVPADRNVVIHRRCGPRLRSSIAKPTKRLIQCNDPQRKIWEGVGMSDTIAEDQAAVTEATAEESADEELLVESLIEDISIDGMCGVY